MLETANSAITLAKEWRKGGDLPYRLVAAVASVLVLVSFYRQERPSNLVSEFFAWLGMEAVGRWFGPEAPPFIANSSSVLQQGFLFALTLLLIWMIVVPAGYEFHQEVPTGSFSKRLLSGRAPATFWLLLLGFLQQGFDSASLQDSLKAIGGVPLGVLTIAASLAAVFLSCTGYIQTIPMSLGHTSHFPYPGNLLSQLSLPDSLFCSSPLGSRFSSSFGCLHGNPNA